MTRLITGAVLLHLALPAGARIPTRAGLRILQTRFLALAQGAGTPEAPRGICFLLTHRKDEQADAASL